MASEKPIRRVEFREAVNMPGDGAIVQATGRKNEQRIIGSTTEKFLPPRGAIDSSRPQFRAFFCDGWIIVEHPQSRIRVRYPISMVREMLLEEDIPKAKESAA